MGVVVTWGSELWCLLLGSRCSLLTYRAKA